MKFEISAAVWATLMDGAVFSFCGPLLWHVCRDVYWERTGLLLMAGGLAFTLMDIWSQALAVTFRRAIEVNTDLDGLSSPTLLESADV